MHEALSPQFRITVRAIRCEYNAFRLEYLLEMGLVIGEDQNLFSFGHKFPDLAREGCSSYGCVIDEMVFCIVAITPRFTVDNLMVFHVIPPEPILSNFLMLTRSGGEEANEMPFIEPLADLFDYVRIRFRPCHPIGSFFV